MLVVPSSQVGSAEWETSGSRHKAMTMLPPTSTCPDYENVEDVGDEPAELIRITGTGTIRSHTLPPGSIPLQPMSDLDYENQDVINEDIIPFQVHSVGESGADFEISTDSQMVLNRFTSSPVAPLSSPGDFPSNEATLSSPRDFASNEANSSSMDFAQQKSTDTMRSESSTLSSGSSTASSPTLQAKHSVDDGGDEQQLALGNRIQDSGSVLSKALSEAALRFSGNVSSSHNRLMSVSNAISPVYSRLESQKLQQVKKML